MSKSKQFPFGNGMPSIPGFNNESFAWMSSAFSEWLHNTNRVQAEVIRFMGERFSKDVKMVSRFAECRNPEDFIKMQNQVLSELAADYQQEGSRMLALFGEASKDLWGEFTRASGAKGRE
jgi:hypothetical protein